MSRNPRSTAHALFMLAAATAASSVAAPADLGADLWRLGGGVMALLWLLGLAAVALPLALLELALCAPAGQDLPAALGERRGPWGAWLGWLMLCAGVPLAAALVARAAWALTPGPEAAAVALGLGLLGALGARSARWTGALGGLALVVLLGGAALSVAGGSRGLDAPLTLLVPRPAALLDPAPWGAWTGHALRATPTALGLLPALLADLPARSRPAGLGLRAALLAALAALLGAVGAFSAWASVPVPPPMDAPIGLAASAVGVTPLAPGVCLAAAALVAAVLRGHRHAGEARGRGASLTALAALSLTGVAALACLWGAPGLIAAEITVTWLGGAVLPALALGLCLAVRREEALVELTRGLDRAGGVRITRWLPGAARWITPAALLLGLGAWSAASLAGGLPGRAEAEALGPLGPLTGALHVVVPGLLLTWLFVASTALTWLPPREAP